MAQGPEQATTGVHALTLLWQMAVHGMGYFGRLQVFAIEQGSGHPTACVGEEHARQSLAGSDA